MKMSVREARSNFAHALALAESGEAVTITKNGKPVAELGPPKVAKKGFDWERNEQWRKEHGFDDDDDGEDDSDEIPFTGAAWTEEVWGDYFRKLEDGSDMP